MEWQMVLALVVAIPVILFPVAFVWFINAGGIIAAVKKARAKSATLAKEKGVKAND